MKTIIYKTLALVIVIQDRMGVFQLKAAVRYNFIQMSIFSSIRLKTTLLQTDHRNFEIELFKTVNGDDWPIRVVFSSYYHTHGEYGIPDGKSKCDDDARCTEAVPLIEAFKQGECAYEGEGYTKVHRDIQIIEAMRNWMGLEKKSANDLDLPNC